MNCLSNYISIKTCEDQTVPEGGFINSLPGISLSSIDASATEDQLTYAGLWEDVQNEAYTILETDFMAEVNRCFELSAYCDYDAMICYNKKRLLQSWKYLLGNQLMIFRIYSSRLNRFTTIGQKEAVELKDHYQLEYEKALKQAIQLVDLGDCEMCCNSDPKTVTWLP